MTRPEPTDEETQAMTALDPTMPVTVPAADVHTPDASPSPASRWRRWGTALVTAIRTGWPTLVFDVLGPIIVFQLAVDLGASEVAALVWSAFPPAIILVVEGVRDRKVNGVGAIVLVSIALALIFAVAGGDAREVVARDSYSNVALGLALIVTLVVGRRPLLYYLLRIPGEDFVPGLREQFAQQWEGNTFFRRFLRQTSLLWGAILILEGVARFVSAYTLPIEVTLVIFQIEGVVLWAVLLWLMVVGFRRARSRWAAQQPAVAPDGA